MDVKLRKCQQCEKQPLRHAWTPKGERNKANTIYIAGETLCQACKYELADRSTMEKCASCGSMIRGFTAWRVCAVCLHNNLLPDEFWQEHEYYPPSKPLQADWQTPPRTDVPLLDEHKKDKFSEVRLSPDALEYLCECERRRGTSHYSWVL